MANFMAKNCGQFSLIVHQVHQLACGVDIATRYRDSIVHAGVQQGHIECVGARGKARLHRNVGADLLHISSIGASHLAAELGHEIIVILRTNLRFFRRNRRSWCDIGTRNAGAGAQREGGSAGKRHGSKFAGFLQRHSGLLIGLDRQVRSHVSFVARVNRVVQPMFPLNRAVTCPI